MRLRERARRRRMQSIVIQRAGPEAVQLLMQGIAWIFPAHANVPAFLHCGPWQQRGVVVGMTRIGRGASSSVRLSHRQLL